MTLHVTIEDRRPRCYICGSKNHHKNRLQIIKKHQNKKPNSKPALLLTPHSTQQIKQPYQQMTQLYQPTNNPTNKPYHQRHQKQK